MILFFQLVVFSTCFIAYGATTSGFYDINELRSISYETNITDEFFWFAPDFDVNKVTSQNIDEYEQQILSKIPDELDGSFVFPTSNSGQKFVCIIPETSGVHKQKPPEHSKNPKYYADAIAASFYVNKCIILKNGGWWKYELCRGQMIFQTHGDPKHIGYVKNVLGIFDGNFTMPEMQASTVDRLLYVAESYSSGTFCDMKDNKNPRRTTVKYVCDSMLGTHEAYIYSVEEVRPCEYEMLVKIGSLCKYNEFLPPNKVNSYQIRCHPYLAKSQVRQLLQKRVLAKEKAVVNKKNREKELVHYEKLHKNAQRRYMTMLKTGLAYNQKDQDAIENARMDHVASYYNYMIAMLTVRDGIPLDKSKNESFWTVINLSNSDSFLRYADYETIRDDDYGSLWYYFHDEDWPKKLFPKSIYYVTAANGHYQRLIEWFSNEEYISFDGLDLESSVEHLLEHGIYNASNVIMPVDDDFIAEWWTLLTTVDRPFWFETAFHSEFDTMLNTAYASISRKFSDLILDATFSQVRASIRRPKEIANTEQRRKIMAFLKSLTPEDGIYEPLDELLLDDDELRDATEKQFRKLLAPFYYILSVNNFRRTFTFFEVHPPLRYITGTDSRYYDFLRALASDYIDFSQMMTGAYLWKFEKEFDNYHSVKPKDDRKALSSRSAWQFEEEWPSIKQRFFPPSTVPRSKQMDQAIREIFQIHGTAMYQQVKKIMVDKRAELDIKVEEELYKKKSRQAREVENLIEFMADDNNDKAATDPMVDTLFGALGDELGKLGEAIERTERKFSEKQGKQKKEGEILDVVFSGDNDEIESKMDQILEMIKNTGVSSDSVQLKVVKVDSDDEMSDEELALASKQFVADVFERFDAKKKFASMENAYSKKYDLEEELDSKESKNSK